MNYPTKEQLDAYLQRFLDMGFRVIPVNRDGKEAVVKWKELTPEKCKAHLNAWVTLFHGYNWGIAPPEGVCVLDIDAKGEVNGFESLGADNVKLLDQLGVPMQQTPNGGRHYFFRANWNCSTNVLRGVDIKNHKGYLTTYPSTINGRPYVWIREIESIDKLPKPPEWLACLIEQNRETKKAKRSKSIEEIMAESIKERRHEGERHNWLRDTCKDLRKAGANENTLPVLARRLNETCCVPPLGQREVDDILQWCLGVVEPRKRKSKAGEIIDTLQKLVCEKYRVFSTGEDFFVETEYGVTTLDSKLAAACIRKVGEDKGLNILRRHITEVVDKLQRNSLAEHYDSFAVRCHVNHQRTILELGGAKGDKNPVRIDETGWRKAEEAERRSCCFIDRTAKPLPQPCGGIEDLGSLADLFNVDRLGYGLLVTWLAHTLLPPPYQILLLTGPAACGKSTITRYLKRVLDNRTFLQTTLPPRETDLNALYNNCYILCFDNVSKIPMEHSNVLCAYSTGSGLVKRKLYTDSDASGVEGARPIIINGLATPSAYEDLLDRCVVLELQQKQAIKCERTLENIFLSSSGRFLGGLLALAVECWKAWKENINTDSITWRIRSSSFRTAVMVVDRLLFGGKGEFIEYINQIDEDKHSDMAEDPIVWAVLKIMQDEKLKVLRIGASRLLNKLCLKVPPDERGEDWPNNAWTLGKRLAALTNVFKAKGIGYKKERSHGKRFWSFTRLDTGIWEKETERESKMELEQDGWVDVWSKDSNGQKVTEGAGYTVMKDEEDDGYEGIVF